MCHFRAVPSLLVTALLYCLVTTASAETTSLVVAGKFSSASEKQVFKRWQPYGFSLFGAKTRYQLVDDKGIQVIQAISDDSASGLIRKLPLQLQNYPTLSWRWKTDTLPTNADDRSKAGDDHSTRLYLIFNAPKSSLLGWIQNAAGWGDTHALNYIWANQSPVDTQLPSPYTDQSIMIAASSGIQQTGQWIEISRNVYQDYLEAFGTPPPPLSAIAIMTDSDNTGTQLTSYYGDIIFHSAENPPSE